MENPLWEFSVRAYSSPEVGAACLSLQDRFDVDINLLLAAAYQGRGGRALSATDIRALADLVRDWQEFVIKPVRQARRAMKQFGEQAAATVQVEIASVRDDVKTAELDCERLEQNLIFDWIRENAPRHPSRGSEALIRDNLVHVLRHFNAEREAESLTPLIAASMSSPEP